MSMETKKYSYQTFPGHTIIRVIAGDGVILVDLVDRLRNNGDGVILVDDEENIPEEILPYIEKSCDTI